MKKLLLILSSLICINAYATADTDYSSICYLFKGDKLINKGTCMVTLSRAFGGGANIIDYKGKKYSFKYKDIMNDPRIYNRDGFYNRVQEKDIEYVPQDQLLTCHKSKPYDVCHK